MTNPSKGYRTETVKGNLEEYGIALDLELLKLKSKESKGYCKKNIQK